MRTTGIAAAIAAIAACSFVRVVPPPDRPQPDTLIQCTDSMGAPVVDLAIGALAAALAALAGAAAVATGLDSDDSANWEGGGTAVAATLVAAPYLWSGLWGRGAVIRCRQHQMRWAR